MHITQNFLKWILITFFTINIAPIFPLHEGGRKMKIVKDGSLLAWSWFLFLLCDKDLENWLQCDLWFKTVFITVKYVALISSFSCSLNVRRNIRIQSHIHIRCIFKNTVMEAGKKDQDGTGDFSCNQEIDALSLVPEKAKTDWLWLKPREKHKMREKEWTD